MSWANAVAGLLVGALVGLTGVGGGSLMSPILILLFGVAPSTAVGTDLCFAAITKTVGGVVHHRHGGADWPVVRWLCLGSLPAALLALTWLGQTGAKAEASGFIVRLLGVLLVLTAILTPFRGWLTRRLAGGEPTDAPPGPLPGNRVLWTVLAGAVLGALVTLTSVGAGALGATMLLALFPVRLTAQRMVGTDIVHAVPLTLVGGLGHLMIGSVDPHLLLGLLCGSVPGIIAGSLLAERLPERAIRPALAAVLLVAGWRLLTA